MRDLRLALVIPVVLAAAAIGFVLGGPSGPSRPLAPAAQTEAVVWSHGSDGPEANAEEHWEKHGAEFPQYHSAQQYERGAFDFVHHPPADALIKHRRNGDTLFYEPSTNTFAVEDAQGEPRTLFKPDRGQAYWARQH
jgi:filamentous hemagglutinin